MIPLAAWYEVQFAPRAHTLAGAPFPAGRPRRVRRRRAPADPVSVRATAGRVAHSGC